MRTTVAAPCLALTLWTSVAAAQATQPASRADIIERLSACRHVVEPTARLSCFELESARLDDAERSGEVVVVSRDEVRQANRSVFGLTMPGFSILNRGRPLETVDRIETQLVSASRLAGDLWLFTLEDGSVWRQIEAANLNRVRPGAKVMIRRGAVGSYLLSVDGARSVRVRRQQ